MKKHLFALLALVLLLVGCPSTAPAPGADGGDFRSDGGIFVRDGNTGDLSVIADASDTLTLGDAGVPHRLGSFNPTCTGTGIPHVVSGVQTAACAGIVNADVAVGAAISLAKVGVGGSTGDVQVNQGGVISAVTGVQAGTNDIALGGSPASAGNVRLPTSGNIYARNVGGTADLSVFETDSTDSVWIGGSSSATKQFTNIYLYGAASSNVVLGNGGTTSFAVRSTGFTENGQPLTGGTGYATSGPWGVHGKTTVATVGSFSLVAYDYSKDAIMLSGGTAGTVTFPTPADDAHAYYKTVINTSGVTKTLSDGGASTPTLATALSGHYLFDTAGVHLTGPSVAYP